MVIVAAVGLLLTACQRTPPPIDPHDAAVIDARDRARQDMDAEVNAIQRVLGARQFSRIEANTCQAGRNDWKTTDPFFSRCEFDVAVGLAYDGDFRQQVEALDELLSSRGWTGLLAASHSLWMWDGEAQSIGRIPRAEFRRGENQLWIIFGSTETSGGSWLYDTGCDLARGTNTKCTELAFKAYFSESTGTPWATAWENAGRPGPLMIVLHFAAVYYQDLR
jgi:hypothetical protein